MPHYRRKLSEEIPHRNRVNVDGRLQVRNAGIPLQRATESDPYPFDSCLPAQQRLLEQPNMSESLCLAKIPEQIDQGYRVSQKKAQMVKQTVIYLGYKAHQKVSSELEEGNELLDRKAKEAAEGEVTVETVEAALIPDGQIFIEGVEVTGKEIKLFSTVYKESCQVLHLGWHNPEQKYSLGGEWIEIGSGEKDQWVFVDKNLDMIQPHELAVQKASFILEYIQSSVASRIREVILLVYSALVGPTWSTASSVGVHSYSKGHGPARASPKEATKMIRGLKHLSYEERQRPLGSNHYTGSLMRTVMLTRDKTSCPAPAYRLDSTLHYSATMPVELLLTSWYTLEEHNDKLPSVQGLELDGLETWPAANHLKFNTSKCQVLHLDQGNPKDKYMFHGERIENFIPKEGLWGQEP
ncbi:hypothetical protein DUI87_06580 [Hirundo rustica rustica]|uniref:Uncharacterized protein n=1 Tax=Hirundo rustica rustica TaxID=333673 RepID=A0A3M0KTK5_HIRRU|nr:hypothetical protein DUI87_06580 [Hirundo rustica rustica]